MMTQNPHSPCGYLIGQAARLSGVSAANIRFYEAKGLINRHGMGAGSYRFYSDEDVHQLRFIRQLRSLDMTLDEVRTLLQLDLRSKRDCQTARDTLDEHLRHVRTRIRELKGLEKDLHDLRNRCDGTHAQCHLIEALHAQADQPVQTASRKKRHEAL
jgi:DNA-binding transcriptional MerR regulator